MFKFKHQLYFFLREYKRKFVVFISKLKAILNGQYFYYANKLAADSKLPFQWFECATHIKQRKEFFKINKNRLYNMTLAVKHLNGLMIKPGEIFCLWHLLPAPTVSNGYLQGPVLSDGKLVYEIGGGLCQVSTTIFQALLEANFEILEKHNHSIDAHGEERYVPLGRDAAVSYGLKDLIARNTTQSTLQLRLKVDEARSCFVVSVFSTKEKTFEVKIENEILESITYERGEGLPGFKVQTKRFWRHITESVNSTDWLVNYQVIESYAPHSGLHQSSGQRA